MGTHLCIVEEHESLGIEQVALKRRRDMIFIKAILPTLFMCLSNLSFSFICKPSSDMYSCRGISATSFSNLSFILAAAAE